MSDLFTLENPSVTLPRHGVTSKQPQSPFLARRNQQRSQIGLSLSSSYPYKSIRATPPASHTVRPSDATSTSSSTLVNIDSNTDYHPWEVRSDSSPESRASSLTTPAGPVQDNVRSSPHRSPQSGIAAASPPLNSRRRATPRAVRLTELSLKVNRRPCPDDCRCSDQDLAVGLCRRAAGSSSSSDSSALSIQVYDTRQTSNPDQKMTKENGDSSFRRSYTSGRNFSQVQAGVQRDVAATARQSRSSTSTLYKSFDQLQEGLSVSTNYQNDSDAESSAEENHKAQRQAELAVRLRSKGSASFSSARRSDSDTDSRLMEKPSVEAQTMSSRKRRRWLSTPSSLSSSHATFQTPDSHNQSLSPFKSPASGRRSIAAVFESMQKERENRAAEEQRQWQEKQEERERQRAARATEARFARRLSASPSAPPAKDSVSLEAEFSADIRTLSDRIRKAKELAVASSDLGEADSQDASARTTQSATPLLSTTTSLKVDEPMTEDVFHGHLQQEVAPQTPETLSEEFQEKEKEKEREQEHEQEGTNFPSGIRPLSELAASTYSSTLQASTKEGMKVEGAACIADSAETGSKTPQPTKPFAFAPQPMALDLSPSGSGADTIPNLSSPASSPRKNAHRRQVSAITSVTARSPPSTVKAAQTRLNEALHRSNDQPVDVTPIKYAASRSTTTYPQTPIYGILSSTRKKLHGDLSTKSKHSVRFSPRPDYRSDSGSWDESEQQLDSPRRPDSSVALFTQPTRDIVIPAILADASKEMDISGHIPKDESGLAKEDVQQDLVVSPISPAKHIPEQDNGPGNGSFIQSVYFPGAYMPSPAKFSARSSITSPVSRHVIRPSPTSIRTKVLNFPSLAQEQILQSKDPIAIDSDLSHTSASSVGSPESSPSRQHKTATAPRSSDSRGPMFGLFPEVHMPRASTPPIQASNSASIESRRTPTANMLKQEDPRSSPRSPRPSPLTNRDDHQTFQAPSYSSSGDESVSQTIRAILATLDTSRTSRMHRNLGTAFGTINDQIASALHSHRDIAVTERTGHVASTILDDVDQDSDGLETTRDKAAVRELRDDLAQALTVLATRVQDAPQGYSAPTFTAGAFFWSKKPWLMLAVALIIQLALMAFLLQVAEGKAQRMRMYAGSDYAISYTDLYRPTRSISAVEWTAGSTEAYLTPLLRLPVLCRLAGQLPPLPSTGMLNSYHSSLNSSSAPSSMLPISTLWDLYRTYITLHGWTPFVSQLAIYTLAQIVSCSLLLLLAPIHILYFLLTPASF